MSPYLPSIIGIVGRFVDGAQVGDSFTCYQFSNSPILVAHKEIERASDKATLKSQLNQLRTVGDYTNYWSVLDRVMADVRSSHKTRPRAERLLILITDGRRHSSDTKSERASLDDLLAGYSDLKGEDKCLFRCFYIGYWPEKDLGAYLEAVDAQLAKWPEDKDWLDKLTLNDVRIMGGTVSLGRIPNAPAQSSFSIRFYPRRLSERISLVEFSVDAEFAKGTLDKFFDVNPRRFVCQEEPWSETFSLETRGFPRGEYSGSFIFRPSEPESLILAPRVVPFKFSILETLQVHVSSPLMFGPTGFRAGYAETKTISVQPSGNALIGSADAISVDPEIELPDGVELTVSKVIKQKEVVINVGIVLGEEIGRQADGRYDGVIKLAPSAEWALSDNEIPITVTVASRGFNFRKLLNFLIVVVIALLAMGILLFLFGGIRTTLLDHLAHKTRPTGRLVVAKDPTRGLAKNVNLDRLSEKKRAKEIVIGMGEGADIEIPHHSLMDKKYRFSGLKATNDVHTIVEAAAGTDEVIVNNMSRTGRVQLMHFDILKLGAIEFRYEKPKPLQQIVLYFLGGEVRQGWPLSWNLESEGFRFLNRDSLPERKESYVRFSELKAVAFVRDFDGELTKRLLSFKVPRCGHRAKIEFADDEIMTGYVLDWKDPAEKFFFFPESLGQNVLFLVIERHTIKNLALLEEDVKGARQAQKRLAEILSIMKNEIMP